MLKRLKDIAIYISKWQTKGSSDPWQQKTFGGTVPKFVMEPQIMFLMRYSEFRLDTAPELVLISLTKSDEKCSATKFKGDKAFKQFKPLLYQHGILLTEKGETKM